MRVQHLPGGPTPAVGPVLVGPAYPIEVQQRGAPWTLRDPSLILRVWGACGGGGGKKEGLSLHLHQGDCPSSISEILLPSL